MLKGLVAALLLAGAASAQAAIITVEFSGRINATGQLIDGQTVPMNFANGAAARGSLTFDTSAASPLETYSYGNEQYTSNQKSGYGRDLITDFSFTLDGKDGETTVAFLGPIDDPSLARPQRRMTRITTTTSTNPYGMSEGVSFSVASGCMPLDDGSCQALSSTSETNDQTGALKPTQFQFQIARSGPLGTDLFGLADITDLDFDLEGFASLPDLTFYGSIFLGSDGSTSANISMFFDHVTIRRSGDPVPAPEPAALALLGLGAVAVGASRRRSRQPDAGTTSDRG